MHIYGRLRMTGVTIILLTGILALGQCVDHEHVLENVALRGKAVQSSTYGTGHPQRAVDGNRNAAYPDGTCSHTQGETNPWWRVDLLGVFRVSSVIITNRGDFLSESINERIKGAEIHIGNSLKDNGNDNPMCAMISAIPAWEPIRFNCSGMVGRYINVFLQGYNQFLTLCEVEVYASPVPVEDIKLTSTLGPSTTTTPTENVALGKKASQSSTSFSGQANRAIDGKHSSWFHMGSCSQTHTEADPWWRVDLLESHNVTSITITNRDDCCAEMIDGAELRIGTSLENNGNNNPLCAVVSSFPAWDILTFQCHEMEGRYVNIFLPGCHKYLTLCEVEVNAVPVPVIKSTSQPEITTENPDSEMTEEDPLTEPRGGNRGMNCSDKDTAPKNAAAGGRATQSTQWDRFGDANNAIDRKRKAVYLKGSCSHTKAETNPWWRVDLLESHKITSVAITNREDCCSERINGAEIHIGNSLKNHGNNNPVCAVIPYIPAGQTRTYQCDGMEGRYVSIVLPGKEKQLTLCEVELNTNVTYTENVALKGKASQSSQYSCISEAQNAIDGSRDSAYVSKSCTHTTIEADPWWSVDLLSVYRVSSVTITNRGDCCPDRINGAQIRIGNSNKNKGNNNPVCAVVSTIPAGESITFQCHGMVGRYVNVIQPGCFKTLTLCEVEVYASPIPENIVMDPVTNDGDNLRKSQCSLKVPDNAATRGKATQSSTGWNGGAEKAIDGNRSPFYQNKSCTHTLAERNPWWRVDLLREHRVTSVTITNRVDCCAYRLDGAQIHVGNSRKNNGNDNPICAVISHIEGESVTFKCHEMQGRYVNVFLPGNDKYLTLCEVEVNGSAIPNDIAATRGKATQSSTGWDGDAEKAIDGNRSPFYDDKSYTHTLAGRNPWWRVDLLREHRVTSVTITNRMDCCAYRLDGAQIHVGNFRKNNGNDNPICAVISHIEGESVTFKCHEMQGRYVNVFLPGNDKVLTLCEVEVNGSAIPNVHTLHNAATRGKATQSSTGWDGGAEKAIDRNRSPFYDDKSCTHTLAERNPWWRVDLLREHRVTSVTITNRMDCCAYRLDGAQIHVGNSEKNNGNDNPICAVISHIEGESVTFKCHEMQGRYVNVFLPGNDKYLTLCEVEVNGSAIPNVHTLHNAATRGKATQSSTGWDGGAEKAIDGNRSPFYDDKSCTHTLAERNPWWRVDLLREHRVTSVTITNRMDCCAYRLDGAQIHVGNSEENNGNDNPVCAVISHIEGDSVTFKCHEMQGRYVNVFLPGNDKYLTLCEVEVNGSAIPNGHNVTSINPGNLALRGNASQSSVLGNGFALNAIDGNHDGVYSHGSCIHTKTEANPWWRVDLGRMCNITSVTVTNRQDCCSESINGAEIRIGNSLYYKRNPMCERISSIPAGATVTFQCEVIAGRYIYIVLPGREKYLTLCEVEVHGIAANSPQ
ncbi:hypothetical protein COCON_G00215190 [Conger conger]|uniref:Fucolectin tachylectin-4 pentraxin-1 domain-containing protein n=1 Tax=Conger conger TaxID=82655 RepID=A0A9Q1CXF4_CONCO|nr:hypothetical protein COCON_G00215190 [Conger conger]